MQQGAKKSIQIPLTYLKEIQDVIHLSKALCLTFQPVKRSASEYKLEITKCNKVLKNQFKYPLHTLRKYRMSHIIFKALCLTFQLVKSSASEYKLEIY